jgi:hypothetical protein
MNFSDSKEPFYGFALYIDVSDNSYIPKYVIYNEVLVKTKGLPVMVIVNDEEVVKRLRLFIWRRSSSAIYACDLDRLEADCNIKVALPPMRNPDWEEIPMANEHLRIEFEDTGDTIPVYLRASLVFPKGIASRYDRDDGIRHFDTRHVMGKMMSKKLHPGMPQTRLGRCSAWIPREFFYLRGEARFTKEWIENKYRVAQKLMKGPKMMDDIAKLVFALTLFINTNVEYTADKFELKGKVFDFENFSDRVLMVGSGDCEDVAAWLMSAFARIKHYGWCGGVLRDYTAINLFLEVDTGAVEGNKNAIIDSQKCYVEKLSEVNRGNGHVTCMLIPTSHLENLINGRGMPVEGKIYLAEGTTMVFPLINEEIIEKTRVDDALAKMKHVAEELRRDVLNARPGSSCGALTHFIHHSVNGGARIFHTVYQIMVNREYDEGWEQGGTVYAATALEGGELVYPVTLGAFISGVEPERNGAAVHLVPTMLCTKKDRDDYHRHCSFEPPNVEMLGDDWLEKDIVEGVDIERCLYYMAREENELDKENAKDLVVCKLSPYLYLCESRPLVD